MPKTYQRKYKNIRIFKSDFMESLTHVHPLIPIILWGPISAGLIFFGGKNLSNGRIAILTIGALVTWTLLEYTIHRFLFHFKSENRIAKELVFLFHGLHHDEPNDPTRLVMPPFPAALFIISFYFLFSLFLPFHDTLYFLGIFLIGYLAYDYIHFATHFFPMKNPVGKYLKKHHISHHNRYHNAKFGVSSPLWDIIFGTYHQKK